MEVRAKPDLSQTLKDYNMKKLTFGVSASCFIANMAVKQNALQLGDKYPLAAEAVHNSLYVDDCLTGGNEIDSIISLQKQLKDLYTSGGFLLRKWNSNEPQVLEAIFPELHEINEVHFISDY